MLPGWEGQKKKRVRFSWVLWNFQIIAVSFSHHWWSLGSWSLPPGKDFQNSTDFRDISATGQLVLTIFIHPPQESIPRTLTVTTINIIIPQLDLLNPPLHHGDCDMCHTQRHWCNYALPSGWAPGSDYSLLPVGVCLNDGLLKDVPI